MMRRLVLVSVFLLFLLGCGGGGGGGGDNEHGSNLETYNFSGKVYDLAEGEENVIPGATVTFTYGVEINKTAVTDENGHYALNGVGISPEQDWVVMKVSKPGYMDSYFTGPLFHTEEERNTDDANVFLTTQEELSTFNQLGIDFDKSIVFGVVVDGNGDPLAGVTVQTNDGTVVYFTDFNGTPVPNPLATQTDANGLFMIYNVSADDEFLNFVLTHGNRTYPVKAWVAHRALSVFYYEVF